MNKNELPITKLKGGEEINPSQKSQRNIKKILKNGQKHKTIVKEIKRRNKDNTFKVYDNNLNSCTLDVNISQSLAHPSKTYKPNNISLNFLSINTEKKNPYLVNKETKICSQNTKTAKKIAVNANKNIEDIIKRRILDNKNINNNSLIKRNTNANKKLKFAKNRAETSKELKRPLLFAKKGKTMNTIDLKNDKIVGSSKNVKEKMNKKRNTYKDKYYETKAFLMNDKLDEDISGNIINKDNDEETYKLYNLNDLNLNTEIISDDKIYNNSNNKRSMNYDYDSCFEEDTKSKKSQLIRNHSSSKPSKNISNDKEHFYLYDSINPSSVSIIGDKKDVCCVNDINAFEINKSNDIKNSHGVEDKKDTENKDKEPENKFYKINLNKAKDNQNDSIVNTNDFSTNANLNSIEKNNNSNNSVSKIKRNTPSIKEIKNIKKNISNTIFTSNSNKLNNSDKSMNNNKEDPQNKNACINSFEIKVYSNIDESSDNPSSNKPNIINPNIKSNVYAPKKLTNHFSIKANNDRNNGKTIDSSKNPKKIEIIYLGENNENESNDKEKNMFSHRIAYTKKISKGYFQKYNSNKYISDRDRSYNELKRNKIKNRTKIHKLNSSFEARNNMQMSNIFMNNNISNNNFDFLYGHGGTSSLIMNTEYQPSNNCLYFDNPYYKLNYNTNKIIYEIKSPNQILSKMNNINKNINNYLKNSNNNNYKNNYNLSIKNDQYTAKNINIDYTDNNQEYLLKKINFEDFIILEEKMIDIKNTLSGRNLVINECFEYLNYYYNSSIYNNFDNLFENDNNIKDLKICLGYKILSVIICYNCSLDINVFEQTYLLLKEIIDLNYKCIILLFEYSFENILPNIETKNLWLNKMKNKISNYNSLKQKKLFNEIINLNNNSNVTILEKIKININYIMNNLNIILSNIKTKNNEYLLILFNSMNEEIYKNIFIYFFNYVLRIINLQGSIIGSTVIQNNLLNNKSPIVPYIQTKNIKKYSLVLDLEETLLHFNMNITNNNQGVVDIRPGAIKFLDNISEYFELIVFNEGEQRYTDILIDSLEENKIYFEHRFYREHISIDNNDVVKDLNKIGRSLDKILIIDNMPQNFKLQKDNGITIKSFWGDSPNDNILYELSIILIKIAKDGGNIRDGLIKYKDEIIKKITIGSDESI